MSVNSPFTSRQSLLPGKGMFSRRRAKPPGDPKHGALSPRGNLYTRYRPCSRNTPPASASGTPPCPGTSTDRSCPKATLDTSGRRSSPSATAPRSTCGAVDARSRECDTVCGSCGCRRGTRDSWRATRSRCTGK